MTPQSAIRNSQSAIGTPAWPGVLSGDALDLWRFLWEHCRGGQHTMIAEKIGERLGMTKRRIETLTHTLMALGFPLHGFRNPVAGIVAAAGICILETEEELTAAIREIGAVIESHRERQTALWKLPVENGRVLVPSNKLPPAQSAIRNSQSATKGTLFDTSPSIQDRMP